MYTPRKAASERDLQLLTFIWCWKLTTTAAIQTKLFSGLSATAAYSRLWALSKGGYVECVSPDTENGFYWTLGKRGFQAVRDSLPPLNAEGYRSEAPLHDALVAAIHLGEWLLEIPDCADILTEQEMRQYHPESFPGWVRTPLGRRPDGLWRIQDIEGRKRTIALEVERSPKSRAEYEDIAHQYGAMKWIDQILWMVTTPDQVRNLDFHCSPIRHGREESFHNFALIPDFKKSGWESKIQAGPEKGKTISEFLNQSQDKVTVKSGESRGKAALYKYLLDTRKSPGSWRHCRQKKTA